MLEIPASVTRVTLVGGRGQGCTELWADSWRAEIQDDGRTLKLFPTGNGHEARQERDAALGKELIAGMPTVDQARTFLDKITGQK